MHRKLLQPLAVAISLALSAGSAFAASSFDVTELDTTINPCNDFNGFVNAKWVAKNPIPADRTRWGAFDQLREHSLETQHDIAEKAAKGADSAQGRLDRAEDRLVLPLRHGRSGHREGRLSIRSRPILRRSTR